MPCTLREGGSFFATLFIARVDIRPTTLYQGSHTYIYMESSTAVSPVSEAVQICTRLSTGLDNLEQKIEHLELKVQSEEAAWKAYRMREETTQQALADLQSMHACMLAQVNAIL